MSKKKSTEETDDRLMLLQRCETSAAALDRLVDQFSADRKTLDAIAFAKKALLYVAVRSRVEFAAFLKEMSQGLSAEKKAQLREQGIDLEDL